MPYVITEPCLGAKHGSCIDVCPVDCISPMPDDPGFITTDQLFIDPDGCIECNACAEACPVNAIFPAEEVPAQWIEYVEINAKHFERT